MKRRLHWKLLLVTTVPAILVIVGVLWLAIDQLAADYFMVLMDEYMVAPTETHRAFLTAVHRYLLWSGAFALVLAFLLSYLMTRRVLRPLAQMAEATHDLGAGNFSVRVAAHGSDEVGQLGGAFNRMADSLERLERLRKTMVSDVAHELRTPLTNLRGYLEGLSDGVIPPDKETLKMLQNEVLRLVHLVEDLGQLSRAEAARAYLERQMLDLGEAIEQMVAVYRPQLEAKQIRVETDFSAGVDQVSADRDKLLQAIRNLVDNAWKYTPVGGRFRVETCDSPDGVKALFVNSGPGIPPADLPYIFERFYRAERSRSRDAGGAGIGLAIVKELIEAHGGSVGVRSEGGETRLWFVLPA
ncbi:MAG: HAMP domain-containing protein [Desulfuromonadales bacterium]|nr:HAMP domain-containing protein [Desulfuromonadales bacterium]NIS39248.1 HAMP domain-containing protein [Desulfuromonadales bacterium]